MKKIYTAYWHFAKYEDLECKHEEAFDYSPDKLHELIDTIMSKGYNVMLHKTEESTFIWIDKGKFGQR